MDSNEEISLIVLQRGAVGLGDVLFQLLGCEVCVAVTVENFIPLP